MHFLTSRDLTLKMPRKPASENCRLFMSSAEYNLANFSNLFLHTGKQTVWTLIRLLLEEQSDLGPCCFEKWLLKSQADDKADDNCCDWQFKGKTLWYPFVILTYNSGPSDFVIFYMNFSSIIIPTGPSRCSIALCRDLIRWTHSFS